MLNEKEEKAIERLKERINDSEDYKTVQVWLTDDVVAVNTVLNLITKLQKENEEKDKQIKTLNHTNKTYKGMLNKQNKQIDLMAEKLVQAHEWFYSEFDNFTKEDFIEYFERKVENDNRI